MEEKPKLEFQDIMKAFELGAISSDEVRNMLAKLGFELIEKEEKA
jgi:ribosomal protein S16